MFLQLILFLLSASHADSDCIDIEDKEIGGLCYKFVNLSMEFYDARKWCHYQSPVPSYLAYVPDLSTSNFLASKLLNSLR